MHLFRIIPVLLFHRNGFYKTVKFRDPKYVGDPINVLRIFNEKEVDEVIVLDIDASNIHSQPNYDRLSSFTSEAFMPLAYGGGINDVRQIARLINIGVEKVVIGASAFRNTDLVKLAVREYGSQAVIVSIDYKRSIFGRETVRIVNGRISTGIHPLDYSKRMEDLGVGELLLSNIERDGTFSGYDFKMIEKVSKGVTIPVVAFGGAASIGDIFNVIKSGASAAAAGSFFVYNNSDKAVLINYPSLTERMKF
jgi:cyclase